MATSIAASFAWTARSKASVPGPPMGTEEEEEGPPGPPLVEPPLVGPPPCRSDRYAERVSADAGSARTGSFIPGWGWVGCADRASRCQSALAGYTIKRWAMVTMWGTQEDWNVRRPICEADCCLAARKASRFASYAAVRSIVWGKFHN